MTQAIFLSYASQDADAARRICDALRATGLEVCFDQSELRGGAAWDASIRKQIKECALFVPMISANTQAREEGYFRLEWKLAVDRSHLMADNKAFFFLIVIDDTQEPAAKVPDKFRERQWSRVTSEAAMSAFSGRIAKLVSGSGDAVKNAPNAAPAQGIGSAAGSVINPADLPSIAVLAFANRSANADDEYFSDGLADELLSVLAKIKGLRVAARTSAFSFKGKAATITEIGHALNVQTVLEGSVVKSGSRVRIAVQLVKIADGYQLWAETYDRTLDDIFAVQDDIAQSVVKELRTVLMGEVANAALSAVISAQVALSAAGRTANAESHALFMHGRYLIRRLAAPDLLEGIGHLRGALDIDSNYAQAWAWLSLGLSRAANVGLAPVHASNTESRIAAERALALNPECVEAHVALFTHELFWGWNWATGLRSAEAAVHLAPNQAEVCAAAALLFGCMGDSDRALRLAQHAVTLDPLSTEVHSTLEQVLAWTDSLAPEAEAAYRKVLELSPQAVACHAMLAAAVSQQGRHEEALQICAQERADWARLEYLAIIHRRVGHFVESERALNELLDLELKRNDFSSHAFQIAAVYADRDDADHAFEWMEIGYVKRDAGNGLLKISRFFRSLHTDPRWPIIMKKMGFAD